MLILRLLQCRGSDHGVLIHIFYHKDVEKQGGHGLMGKARFVRPSWPPLIGQCTAGSNVHKPAHSKFQHPADFK